MLKPAAGTVAASKKKEKRLNRPVRPVRRLDLRFTWSDSGSTRFQSNSSDRTETMTG